MLLAVWAVRTTHRIGKGLSMGQRISLLAVGLISLFLWAGFYIGPILFFLAALYPKGAPKEQGKDHLARTSSPGEEE
jgi:hypothetical protein